jgi:iron(III) transport system substrate-binding protein
MNHWKLPVLVLAVLLSLAGCDGAGNEPGTEARATALTVYAGRNENLVGPILGRFTQKTGVAVDVRYGSTSELVATLLEEGEHTPADLFISQDAAALGALSKSGMLRQLAEAQLDRVPQRFRSPNGDWVGLSGRARVVVYNTDRMTPDQLPQSLADVVDSRFSGRWGVAPTNASFQAHMALVAALGGQETLTELLAGMVSNEPNRYPKNSPIVAAVIAGEIDWGLTNHYYLWRALKENPDAPAKNYFMPAGDASSFINMAGVGMLSEHADAAQLIDFLLSDEAQTYFAEETFEYPLVPGVPASVDLPALELMQTPDADYRAVSAALERALQQILDSGLIDH